MKEIRIDRRDVLTGIAGGFAAAACTVLFANDKLPSRKTARSILQSRKEKEPEMEQKTIYRGRITIEKQAFDNITEHSIPLFVRKNPQTDSTNLTMSNVLAMGTNKQRIIDANIIHIYNPEIVTGEDVVGFGNKDDMLWVKTKMIFLDNKGEEIEEEMHFNISKHPDATGKNITREPAGITEIIQEASVLNGIGYIQNGETTEQISVGFVTTSQTDSEK